MAIKKIEYEDAYMMENIINKINEIIDEVNDQDKRIDRHWRFHRLREKEDKKEEDSS